MSRTLILAIITVVALLGIADSWYLAEAALTHEALTCDFGAAIDGCNTVAQSPYSHLGGIPLGIYGVGFYTLIFLIASLMFVFNTRVLYHILMLLAVVGLIASVVFVLIQIFLIKALCVYCLASAGFAFLIAAFAWKLYTRAPTRLVIIQEA